MIVGLTGGIGSGKSTVAGIFKQLGVPVFEADLEARELMDNQAQLQDDLLQLLGKQLIVNGRINRPYMASRVFNDETLLRQVNALVHPAVAVAFSQWHGRQQAPYVLREAAILFESGSHADCDRIVVVSAPRELRIKRVMQRNQLSRAQVLERMSKQWPEEEKLARADYVVVNDHSQSLIKQVLSIHEDLIRLTDKGSR